MWLRLLALAAGGERRRGACRGRRGSSSGAAGECGSTSRIRQGPATLRLPALVKKTNLVLGGVRVSVGSGGVWGGAGVDRITLGLRHGRQGFLEPLEQRRSEQLAPQIR